MTDPRKSMERYYSLRGQLPETIAEKVSPSRPITQQQSVHNSAEERAIAQIMNDPRLTLEQKEQISNSILEGRYEFIADVASVAAVHGSNNGRSKPRIIPIDREKLRVSDLTVKRHNLPKPSFLEVVTTSAEIPVLSGNDVRKQRFGLSRQMSKPAMVNPKRNLLKALGTTDAPRKNEYYEGDDNQYEYAPPQPSFKEMQNRLVAEHVKKRMERAKEEHRLQQEQAQQRRELEQASIEKRLEVKKKLQEVRKSLKEHLTNNRDPLLGQVMRCVDESLIYHFMEKYKGFSMSVEAILALVGTNIGTTIVRPGEDGERIQEEADRNSPEREGTADTAPSTSHSKRSTVGPLQRQGSDRVISRVSSQVVPNRGHMSSVDFDDSRNNTPSVTALTAAVEEFTYGQTAMSTMGGDQTMSENVSNGEGGGSAKSRRGSTSRNSGGSATSTKRGGVSRGILRSSGGGGTAGGLQGTTTVTSSSTSQLPSQSVTGRAKSQPQTMAMVQESEQTVKIDLGQSFTAPAPPLDSPGGSSATGANDGEGSPQDQQHFQGKMMKFTGLDDDTTRLQREAQAAAEQEQLKRQMRKLRPTDAVQGLSPRKYEVIDPRLSSSSGRSPKHGNRSLGSPSNATRPISPSNRFSAGHDGKLTWAGGFRAVPNDPDAPHSPLRRLQPIPAVVNIGATNDTSSTVSGTRPSSVPHEKSGTLSSTSNGRKPRTAGEKGGRQNNSHPFGAGEKLTPSQQNLVIFGSEHVRNASIALGYKTARSGLLGGDGDGEGDTYIHYDDEIFNDAQQMMNSARGGGGGGSFSKAGEDDDGHSVGTRMTASSRGSYHTSIAALHSQLVEENILPALQPEIVLSREQLEDLGLHKKTFNDLMKEISRSGSLHSKSNTSLEGGRGPAGISLGGSAPYTERSDFGMGSALATGRDASESAALFNGETPRLSHYNSSHFNDEINYDDGEGGGPAVGEAHMMMDDGGTVAAIHHDEAEEDLMLEGRGAAGGRGGGGGTGSRPYSGRSGISAESLNHGLTQLVITDSIPSSAEYPSTPTRLAKAALNPLVAQFMSSPMVRTLKFDPNSEAAQVPRPVKSSVRLYGTVLDPQDLERFQQLSALEVERGQVRHGIDRAAEASGTAGNVLKPFELRPIPRGSPARTSSDGTLMHPHHLLPDGSLAKPPIAIKTRPGPTDEHGNPMPRNPYSSHEEESAVLNTGVPAGSGYMLWRPRYRTSNNGRYRAGQNHVRIRKDLQAGPQKRPFISSA